MLNIIFLCKNTLKLKKKDIRVKTKAMLNTSHFKCFSLFLLPPSPPALYLIKGLRVWVELHGGKQRFWTENPRLRILNVRWWEVHIIAFDFLGLSPPSSLTYPRHRQGKFLRSHFCTSVFSYHIVFSVPVYEVW